MTITRPDHTASPADDARSAWFAYRAEMGEALPNVGQSEIWNVAFSQGVRWCFRTTSHIAPWMDTLARLMEYLAAPNDRCPNCGEKL